MPERNAMTYDPTAGSDPFDDGVTPAPESAFDIFPDAHPRPLTTAQLLANAPRVTPGTAFQFQGPPPDAPRIGDPSSLTPLPSASPDGSNAFGWRRTITPGGDTVLQPPPSTPSDADLILAAHRGKRQMDVKPAGLDDDTWRARGLFAEVGNLYPQLVDPTHVQFDPNNWDPASSLDLMNARSAMAEIMRRNPDVKHKDGSGLRDPFSQVNWVMSKAGASGDDGLPPGVRAFNIRNAETKGDTPPDRIVALGNRRFYRSYGPFVSNGGGDAGKGSRIYIDLYRTSDSPVGVQARP
jgi:hypothetical protein